MSTIDKLGEHLKNNRGKYSAIGSGVVTLGGINLAGNGYLGTNIQDTVHDISYPVSNAMKTTSIENGVKASIDPYIDVYKKTDNILNNDQNQKLLDAEKILQKENIPAIGSGIGSKLLDNLTGLTPNEKLNFILRNPSEGISLKMSELSAPTHGISNTISDLIH